MRQVRYGVFETNSSSMHSIVVMKENEKFKGRYDHPESGIYIENDGEWRIWDDNDLCFGRYPFRILSTFEDKFYYAVASLCAYKPVEEATRNFNELIRIAKKYIPEIKNITVPVNYQQAYSTVDGRKLQPDEVHWHKSYDAKEDKEEYCYKDDEGKWVKATPLPYEEDYQVPDYGDVDHDSCGLLESFLKNEKVSLEDFLINKKYTVVIDGDEYYEFDKMLNSGVLDDSSMDYQFSTDGNKYAIKRDTNGPFSGMNEFPN